MGGLSSRINRDGTIRRGNDSDLRNVETRPQVAPDISVFAYYIIKLLFLFLCAALALACAVLLSYLRESVFGDGYVGFRDIIRLLYPLLSFLASGRLAYSYVVHSVGIEDWRKLFLSPLVTLAGFLAAFVLLYIFDWSMSRWWTLVLFCILFLVGTSVISDMDED